MEILYDVQNVLVYKRGSGMKNQVKAAKDSFVCKMSSRRNMMINGNVGRGLSLNSGDCIE